MNKRKPGTVPRATRRGRPTRTEPEAAAGSSSITVAAECTVADASSLKTVLAKLLDATEVVTLDVGAVQRIDTAGLQLLATFVREREMHGRQVQWQGEAPVLATAAKLLGLSELLKFPFGEAVEMAP